MRDRTCTYCDMQFDEVEDENADEPICPACLDLEEPSFEPEELDFKDHSHELPQDEEELE